jgi:hypothetical protein
MRHDGAGDPARAHPIVASGDKSMRSVGARPARGNARYSDDTLPFAMRLGARLIAALALATVGSCRNPRVDANLAEALMQMGAQLSGVQQDYASLQGEVDSLRTVVARQDTIINRLAALANLPVEPR